MILVVDDDKTIRLSLKLILERNEYQVALAEEPKAAIDIVRNTPSVELVLMDMNYTLSTSGEEGLTLLKQIKVFRPDVPCILMTAWGSIDLAVQGMRAGAFDFITKPWDNGVLLDRIETALKLNGPDSPPALPVLEGSSVSSSRAREGAVTFDDSHHSSCQIHSAPSLARLEETLDPSRIGRAGGESGSIFLPSLASIYATISRIAPTNAPVLITGESGTGKELIAEAIHNQSRRAAKPFVKVNLGGISTSLFESEMFGHKKGSFTDAKADRVGRFELANGGTIFLDEIGELELASQVKLLRVLQDQTYEVLGDSHTRRTDVRVICATNANLRQMVEEHTFREDLFYRINLIHLHLPPLRERPEDIPLLANHFLRQSCLFRGDSIATTRPTRSSLPLSSLPLSSLPLSSLPLSSLPLSSDLPIITPDAIAYLQSLPFTGNIRELKNLVERTLLMSDGKAELTADDFAQQVPQQASEVVYPSVFPTGNPSSTLEDLERAAIAAAIQRHAGNLSLVAKELGISRGALYRKIEKHGL